MIIIRNSGLFASRSPDSPEVTQKYISLFSDIPDFCCLILIEEKIDKRKKVLLEVVSGYGSLVRVDRQSTDALCKWVGTALHKENIRITMEAINSLVDRTEGNMRVLSNEIQKIVLYCAGSGIQEITLNELEAICIPDIRGSIFQMTDAIGTRNTGRALTVLDTLISMKEPVPKIRFMLSRHLRQLICAKELSTSERIMSELKVVPFVARNLSSQAKYFKMEELVELYEACALSDFSVKTGRIDDRLSLETLLVGAGREQSTNRQTSGFDI
jgi:DNA polymerase-3 subunit delta